VSSLHLNTKSAASTTGLQTLSASARFLGGAKPVSFRTHQLRIGKRKRRRRARSFVFALLALSTCVVRAQNATQTTTGPTRPTQVPLSGRTMQDSTVSVEQQTSTGSSGNGVVTVDTSVTIQGVYAGGVHSSVADSGMLSLSLKDALSRGLRVNLGAITQSAAVQQAQGQRLVARSELLPQLNSVISEESERENLRELGVESTLGPFPEAVKFHFFDARAVRLSQSVFDLVRIRNLRSATETLKGNRASEHDTRDLLVLAVGGSYLEIVQTKARIESANAEVKSDEAFLKQGQDRFDAGLNTRVDVTRQQVQLQRDQLRASSLQADLENQKLRLARLIGLAFGQQFDLVSDYPFQPDVGINLEFALLKAFADRWDIKAAKSAVGAAEESLRAAHSERLPTITVTGDFGAAGVTPTNQATGVYTAAGTLTIPLYEGGRIRGDIEQASAAVRQRKGELEDTRAQVNQDVRQAFVNLNTAARQVVIAQENVALAKETLAQSKDRFLEGIADSVEVVQSEQSVVQADDDLITATFAHSLNKVALARAMGDAEVTLPQLLRTP
jgi:outer membrane protein TolC